VPNAYYFLRPQFPVNSGSKMQNPAGFLLWVVFRILDVKNNKVHLAEGVGGFSLCRGMQ